jgi:hypothetical protein
MFWAYFFCTLPLVAIYIEIRNWLFLPEHGRAVAFLAWVMMNLLSIPFSMISIGTLSLAYRHVFEGSR